MPLFMGVNGQDLRGLNVFKSLGDTEYWPPIPHVSKMGHLSWELFSWVYWPSNFDDLMKKHGYKSVNGFPPSESDLRKAESLLDVIKDKWRAVELSLLEHEQDEDEQERLFAN